MIFAAYFDASTSQKGRKFVTVSGCLASVARWKTFDSKWHKMLRKESLPYFHMTDFEAYQGHYKDWNKARHKHLFKKIARTITGKQSLHSVAGSPTMIFCGHNLEMLTARL